MDTHHRRGNGDSAADECHLAVVRAHVADVGVVFGDRDEARTPQIDDAELPASILHAGGDDFIRRGECKGRQAEDPLRHTELGRHRQHVFNAPVRPAIEIPPPVAVGDKIEPAIGRELRLENRLRSTTGDVLQIAQRARVINPCGPEFRAVPRHVGVVPRKPRQRFTHRIDTR